MNYYVILDKGEWLIERACDEDELVIKHPRGIIYGRTPFLEEAEFILATKRQQDNASK